MGWGHIAGAEGHDRWAGGIHTLALAGIFAGLGGISLALGALTLELDGIVAGLGHTHDAEPPPQDSLPPQHSLPYLAPRCRGAGPPSLYNNGNMPVFPFAGAKRENLPHQNFLGNVPLNTTSRPTQMAKI